MLQKKIITLYCRSLHKDKTLGFVFSKYLSTWRETPPVKSYPQYTVSTPIFYVNAVPHIGHLYTAALADATARWQKIKGRSVLFSTGTDEHGLKIQQAAHQSKATPAAFCDQVSLEFKDLFDLADIHYDDFIRTTEQRHSTAVHNFWRRLAEKELIYKGSYEGWYCTSEEAFLTPDQVIEVKDKDGRPTMVSSEGGQPVEWTQEENYMFRLSQFTEPLLEWLNKGVIQPTHFEALVRSWIGEGLPDLSVSRQRERLHWGITVPDDDSQTIYVWLDALINYLTVVGYPDNVTRWPTDCHIVGKDILKFHAIYWPAFLIGAGLKPPKSIFCHSHWLMGNMKMSKSKGNVVDPKDRISQYTADGLRYFLLRAGVPHADGNYNDKKVIECLNAELANNLGNLLSRCSSKALNPKQIFPCLDEDIFMHRATDGDKNMLAQLYNLPYVVDKHYEDYNFYKAIDAIMAQLRDTNAFVQHHKPWELVKSPEESAMLECVLFVALETVRLAGVLLQPVVPRLADCLLTRLNIPSENRTWGYINARSRVPTSLQGGNIGPLFARLKSS